MAKGDRRRGHNGSRTGRLTRHRGGGCGGGGGGGVSPSSSSAARVAYESLTACFQQVLVGGLILLCMFPQEGAPTVNMVNHCGNTIRSTGDLIFSQGGLYYPPDLNCTVTIATPDGGGYVLLQLKEFDLRSREDCSDDYLELSNIHARDDDGRDVASKQICSLDSPQEVVSRGSFLRLHMATDSSGNGRGWAGVFTNVFSTDISLCLTYDRFHCSNGRCIPSVLRCDSVDHCGDNSDEELGCQDGLPTYLGDRLVEHHESIYIGLAVAFTALFAIYFSVVCTRDSIRKLRVRIRQLLTRQKEPKVHIDEELKQVLMRARANPQFQKRVSQPYDTTLNTITGGELARQLKLELKKLQETQANANTADGSDMDTNSKHPHHGRHLKLHVPFHFHKPHHHHHRHQTASSPTEDLHLINSGNTSPNDDGAGFTHLDVPRGVNTSESALHEGTPTVVLSQHGVEEPPIVLVESSAPSTASSSPQTLGRKKPASRFEVTVVPETQAQSKPVTRTKSAPATTTSKSRFSVTRVPDEEVPKSSESIQSESVRPKQHVSITISDESDNETDSSTAHQLPDGHSGNTDDLPCHGHLAVPPYSAGFFQKRSRGRGKRQKPSRFTVKIVNEDQAKSPTLKNIEKSSEASCIQNEPSIQIPESSSSQKPVVKSSRFTVQKVAEEPGKIQKAKVRDILPKIETHPALGKKGKGRERFLCESNDKSEKRRGSVDGASDGSAKSDAEKDLPPSAKTFHGYTSVKFWNDASNKYSFITHL